MKALFTILCVFAVAEFWQEEYAAMAIYGLGAWVLEGMIMY